MKMKKKKKQEQIQNLTRQLNDVEEAEREYLKSIKEKESELGIKLPDSQMKEYTKLKEQVSKSTSVLQQELDQISRQYQVSKEDENNLKRKLKELRNKKEHLTETLESLNERVTKFQDFVTKTKKIDL